MLYTSGTTGKPKGTACTLEDILPISMQQPNGSLIIEMRTFFCTADIGWVTGHSYMVYAPLLHGVTSVIYEGTPDFPTPDRYWALIEKHRATILHYSNRTAYIHEIRPVNT